MKARNVSFFLGTAVSAIVGALLLAAPSASASIIFDDFNVDEGHFNLAPTFSGTTAGILTTSTADRATEPSPFEGAGFERLVLNVNGTVTTRVRFLSGGGTPANNISFSTTDGTDGWIGFYARTTAEGWVTSLNLDSPANTGATMAGSTSLSLISDGQWHLYEWNLDGTTWGTVPGIGGIAGPSLPNGTWTIDSIYFRALSPVSGTATIDFDFVAKSDSGSIAALIPEPSSALLGILGGGLILFALKRRRA